MSKASKGEEITASSDAIVFHLAINSIGQRGISTLLPALGEFVRSKPRPQFSQLPLKLLS